MPTLTIHDFDDELHATLQVRANQHGRTVEDEARAIIAEQVTKTRIAVGRWGSQIRVRVPASDGVAVAASTARHSAL